MKTSMLKVSAACLVTLALQSAAPARAQDLSSLLPTLFGSGIELAPPAAGQPSHQTHFEPGIAQSLVPIAFNRNLVSELSTFPLGSSSGGFSYTFDPETGTPQRISQSFGAAFAERALTLGARQWNIGMYYQHTSYDSFEGQSLGGGQIQFYIQHQDPNRSADGVPSQFFRGDLIRADLRLNLKTDTAVFYANYGVTNALDVGLVVPVQHVSMDASVDAHILRLATTGITPPIHRFEGSDQDTHTFSSQGSASGIGDVVLRAKYRFWKQPEGGLAAGADLRLPSGDQKNLLGSGATQLRLAIIGSASARGVSPHVNLGYTFSHQSSGDLNIVNELGYAAGVDFAVRPRLTVSGDLFGRSLRDFGRMQLASRTFKYQAAPDFVTPPGPVQTFAAQELAGAPGSLNVALAAVGGKFNPWQNLLISAHLLVPLTSNGLRPNVTPVVGFDYAF